MSENILVAVAWPYANGPLHIGHAAGVYIPADIFARYQRLKGNNVLMVSGSDSHGTPVTLEAEKQGVSEEDIFQKYHAEFLGYWESLGVTFDLFTSTHTENHAKIAQKIFLDLYNNGYIYKDTTSQPYCTQEKRFLADRYVHGKCPHCDFEQARGDQCDNCGRTLDPQELIDMTCLLCGDHPTFKNTEHFFLKLSHFEKSLIDWVKKQSHWRPNVRNFSIGYLEGGLKDRAITRDIKWGIPVPIDGYEDKSIYVWFEAVVGYLSASQEWANGTNNKDQWKDYWLGNSRSYYFMGKDNIPFHTIIWPAMLMGSGELNLPYDVPANEYLNLEGLKLSTSRNWAVWLSDYLKQYEPDPLRYVISSNMPETSDSDFSWKEYVRANNDELVATYGNLVHRVLTMVHRKFEGRVPTPKNIDTNSRNLFEEAKSLFEDTGKKINECKFRAGLSSAMTLAQSVNRYLDQQAPWKATPEDAATTLWVSLSVINCLKIALYPFLPFSSEKLHLMLGFEGSIQDNAWTWDPDQIQPNVLLPKPNALFTKLDYSVVEQETQLMG